MSVRAVKFLPNAITKPTETRQYFTEIQTISIPNKTQLTLYNVLYTN